MTSPYPRTRAGRTRWILNQRPNRNSLSPDKAHARFLERECSHENEIVESAVVFLTNRECPWKCLMCDLWRNTLDYSLSPGKIPRQMEEALETLYPGPRSPKPNAQIKLYNSGSFFDRQAIPREDYPAIARQAEPFRRVIVECHPRLIDARVLEFRELLNGSQEIAIGLETAHPSALEKLNKGATLDDFQRAAAFLRKHEIGLRVFLLVHPPFIAREEAGEWLRRSIDFALDCQAGAISLIPTRAANGALEMLSVSGDFKPPPIRDLEAGLDFGIQKMQARVFADLWDLESFSDCPHCFLARKGRLTEMNLKQTLLPAIACSQCHDELSRGI